ETAELGEGMRLVSRRDGRVRREDDRPPRGLPRLPERDARLHAVGDQLDASEDGVPFVEVVRVDGDPEATERAHATDAEQYLLGDAAFRHVLVEPVCDPGVLGLDRLEEIERRAAPALDVPHARLDLARSNAHA